MSFTIEHSYVCIVDGVNTLTKIFILSSSNINYISLAGIHMMKSKILMNFHFAPPKFIFSLYFYNFRMHQLSTCALLVRRLSCGAT